MVLRSNCKISRFARPALLKCPTPPKCSSPVDRCRPLYCRSLVFAADVADQPKYFHTRLITIFVHISEVQYMHNCTTNGVLMVSLPLYPPAPLYTIFCIAYNILYHVAVICPWSKFHETGLLVEWKIFNINFAKWFVNSRWFPYYFAGVVQNGFRHYCHFIISISTETYNVLNIL